jgi:hypothetical protein
VKKSSKEMVGKKGPIFVDLGNVRELERGSVIAGVPASECAKRKT